MQKNTELQSTMSRTEAPSLVQLCIKAAVNNLSHIRDVGDTEINLLKEILNKCNPDQLSHIEDASTVRLTQDKDLRSVTEALWHQFYIQKFGVESGNGMEQLGVPLNWRQIYEDKSNEEWRITVNTTATTPGPAGCLKKLLDKFKKVCETLRKMACGDVRCIRLNAEVFGVLFISFIFISVFATFTYVAIICFIEADYGGAIVGLIVLVMLVIGVVHFMLAYYGVI